MVFTTNKPIKAWGKALHDPDLAEAILDRLLERGRVLPFKGSSYRTRHLRPEGVAKVSGKVSPGFREPTLLEFETDVDRLATVVHSVSRGPLDGDQNRKAFSRYHIFSSY